MSKEMFKMCFKVPFKFVRLHLVTVKIFYRVPLKMFVNYLQLIVYPTFGIPLATNYNA